VLVVDDEPMVLHLCTRILEAEGYRVLTAVDGLEALRVLRHAGAEIRGVISDLQMPQLNGLQLAACLGDLDPSPPLMFISGYTVDQPSGRSVLQKPFHPSDLIAAVERLLVKVA
jgi:two-component system cell cycle sensor histidine kinase/response regulator CckA